MVRSLRSRLFFSYLAIILVCLLVAGLALLTALRLRQTQQRIALQRLNDLAQITAIALRGRDIEPQRVTGLLKRLAEARKVRVLLLDAQGSVLLDSQDAMEGQSFLESARFKRDAEGALQGTFRDDKGQTWLFVARPTSEAPRSSSLAFATLQPRGAVLVWARDNLLVPLVWAGLVSLVFSTLLALLLNRSVAGPLRRVADAAEAISHGEVTTRSPVAGPSEVRALGRSFNRMADQVEATQRSQRDFVANVSHELKTPLTSIQGFSQAILDGTADEPAAVGRAASVIREEAERMRRMVNDLLVLARFDAGQVKAVREPVRVDRMLRACVEKLAPQAKRVGVTVEIDTSGKHVVCGDADQLGQVFTNVLDNALTHTPAGGRVTVAAHAVAEARAVNVTVTDTGAGIPPEELPRIFERFYRADKARRRAGGAGLGLAIAKEIVAAHGGTITAESLVGLGSRFVVQLPLEEEDPAGSLT
jgi:signal transduction histidine kinase